MTPITEDHVQDLMTGLARREKEAMKRLSESVERANRSKFDATAVILDFAKKTSREGRGHRAVATPYLNAGS